MAVGRESRLRFERRNGLKEMVF
ncbi:hypothetical protein CCACVL1_27605 [Corchorus capsularis]|uniref:Uncharacterized protein n=1 Tax=Corchorus capsularis TaxID=210143 RepID=A0A1R3G9M3_COCAP|nr:hypothetical protein CCACVL1_27605 [Corchorus capsularis]